VILTINAAFFCYLLVVFVLFLSQFGNYIAALSYKM